MKEEIRTYNVKFAADTVHTEMTVKAYSKTDAETPVKKMFVSSKVSDIETEEAR